MKKVLSLYLPTWPVDLARRRHRPRRSGPPNRAILLVTTVRGQQRVAARCQRAQKAGVHVGMSLAHARALLGSVNVLIDSFMPQQDEKALGRLAQWANRFSPVIAPDPPDGLLLDITGCGHLFGGERRLLDRLIEAVCRLDFRACGAVAPTVGCAWAVARHREGNGCVVSQASVRDALAPLPVCSLRVDEQVVEALHEVGVDRVGQLLELPRSQLPSRFGEQLLLRLDQALGQALETIQPFRPREPVCVERVFDGATTRYEAVELATQDLVAQLCEKLATQERGARSVNLVLERLDVDPTQIDVTLSGPSRHAKHLWALFRPHLERVNLGFGVEEIALTATRTSRLPHEQAQHWKADSPTDTRPQSAELIDALTNRLGPDQITRVETIESHIPEQACLYRSLESPSHRNTTQAQPPLADRPSMLLDRPEPIEVIAVTPDGPVASLRLHGSDHRVVTSIGPERISPSWWRHAYPGKGKPRNKNEKQGRDYFKVQDEQGRWLWVFRDLATRRWFLHGQWA